MNLFTSFMRSSRTSNSPRTSAPSAEQDKLPTLDRLQLSDEEEAADAGGSEPERPSRMLRVSGLDGVGVDVEIHSRDSVGMVKRRISAVMGVHKDLQEVFDETSEEPFDDEYELPDETTELTVVNKTPELHKVTPGPPLNCRTQAHREAKVVASFQPGDIVKVIGDRIKGGVYGESHSDWVPILVEVKKKPKTEENDDENGTEEKAPATADADNNDDDEDDKMEDIEHEMELTKAWCAFGSDTEAYLAALTYDEQQEYYLRG